MTRTLRWVRLGQDLDLLDAPGVLPPRLDDQQAALRLALCDDIGQAAYDGELVAPGLPAVAAGCGIGLTIPLLQERLWHSPERPDPRRSGETARMAQRLLDDFRNRPRQLVPA